MTFKSDLISVGLSINNRKHHFLLEAVEKNKNLEDNLKIFRLENNLNFCKSIFEFSLTIPINARKHVFY